MISLIKRPLKNLGVCDMGGVKRFGCVCYEGVKEFRCVCYKNNNPYILYT